MPRPLLVIGSVNDQWTQSQCDRKQVICLQVAVHRSSPIIKEKIAKSLWGHEALQVPWPAYFKTIKARQDHSAVSGWRDEGNSSKCDGGPGLDPQPSIGQLVKLELNMFTSLFHVALTKS